MSSVVLLSKLPSLSESQKSALKKANIIAVCDLLLAKPVDISKKCRFTPTETKQIIDAVCKDCACVPRPLHQVKHEGDERFTTGDVLLDCALGSGIKTGMIWEIFGESAAGKTQLALQLSLTVQLPSKLGGSSGSACYLTTSSQLPTERLVQICENHPSLSPELCGLHDIHTLTAETIPKLVLVLSKHLPELICRLSNDSASKPVRLVVIDSLAELFHSAGRTSTNTLVERSRGIIQVSQLLHDLASKYAIAIVVLNEVSDVFHRGETSDGSHDLLYHEQARWFSRADSIPGENSKEAALGLVWANQVNARIMLSRTNRRRHFDLGDKSGKRRRLDPEAHSVSSAATSNTDRDGELLPVRRLSIIFSSVSLPASLDFIVTVAGVSIVPDAIPPNSRQSVLVVQQPLEKMPMTQVPPLDEGCIRDEINAAHSGEVDVDAEWAGDDEDEQYWKDDEISEELYSTIDLGTVNEPETKEFAV